MLKVTVFGEGEVDLLCKKGEERERVEVTTDSFILQGPINVRIHGGFTCEKVEKEFFEGSETFIMPHNSVKKLEFTLNYRGVLKATLATYNQMKPFVPHSMSLNC